MHVVRLDLSSNVELISFNTGMECNGSDYVPYFRMLYSLFQGTYMYILPYFK